MTLFKRKTLSVKLLFLSIFIITFSLNLFGQNKENNKLHLKIIIDKNNPQKVSFMWNNIESVKNYDLFVNDQIKYSGDSTTYIPNSFLDYGSYSAFVRANFANDNELTGKTVNFTIGLKKPELINFKDGVNTYYKQPKFYWDVCNKAEYIELYLDKIRVYDLNTRAKKTQTGKLKKISYGGYSWVQMEEDDGLTAKYSNSGYGDGYEDALEKTNTQNSRKPGYRHSKELTFGKHMWGIVATNRTQNLYADVGEFTVLKLGNVTLNSPQNNLTITGDDKPEFSWSAPIINDKECEAVSGEDFIYELYIGSKKVYSGKDRKVSFNKKIKDGNFTWYVIVKCGDQFTKSELRQFTVSK